MPKVWVVLGQDYDGTWVEGVFTSVEPAEAHRNMRYRNKRTMYNAEGWRVEEWELDSPLVEDVSNA